jgi:hypothetical protein
MNALINGLAKFPLPGRYLELLSTVNPVRVTGYDKHERVLFDYRDVAQGFWVDRRDREPFARIEITTGASELVNFLVTDGMAGNRSVPSDLTSDAARLVGIVYGSLGQLVQLALNAVNLLRVHPVGAIFADDHVAGNEAFIGVRQQAAVAANYGHIQLKNEAASGKIVYVDKVTCTGASGGAAYAELCHHDASLTDIAAGVNKNLGGAAATAHLRQTDNAAQQGTMIARKYLTGTSDAVFEFNPPLRLGEGEAVLTRLNVVNLAHTTTFEWRERAV